MRARKLFLSTFSLCFLLSASGYAQMCKKLKVTSATAQEIIPGTPQEDRSTDYRFEIKVKGKQPIAIKSVCVEYGNNAEALKYSVMDVSGSNTVSTLENGETYLVVMNSGKKARGGADCDPFEGVALITYSYGDNEYTASVKTVQQLENATRR